MPLPAASIPHASLLALLLVLGATASVVPAGDGDDVPPSMMMLTNGSGTTSPVSVDTETYICYLCTGRNPLLIRYCPIYWDECHLVCYDDDASATAAIPAAAPVPTTAGNPIFGVHDDGDDECYVMKLYRNGSYAIVTRLGCARIARCLLSCGGGDMAASSHDDRNSLGAAAATTSAVPKPKTTAAVQAQGSFTPRLADFQRCGTQVTAPPSLRGGGGGGGVRDGGGARRRR